MRFREFTVYMAYVLLFAIAVPSMASAQLNDLLQQGMGILNNVLRQQQQPTPPVKQAPVSPRPAPTAEEVAPRQHQGHQTTAPPPRVQAGSSEVRELQQMLDELGYDVGKPDGKLGARSVRAIRAFEQANGLPLSGKLGPETAAAIRAASAGRPDTEGPDVAQSENTRQRVLSDDTSNEPVSEQPTSDEANRPTTGASSIVIAAQNPAGPQPLAQVATPRPAPGDSQNSPAYLTEPTEVFAALPGTIFSGILTFSQADRWPRSVDPSSRDFPLQDLIRLTVAGSAPDYLQDPYAVRGMLHLFDKSAHANVLSKTNANPTWAGEDEFAQARSENDFRNRLTPLLRERAPRVPFLFGYTAAVSLKAYDVTRAAFPIGGAGDDGEIAIALESVQANPYRIAPDFRWPDLVWPVAPDKAEASLHELGKKRQAKLLAVFELGSIDLANKTMPLHLRRLSLYNADMSQHLYQFTLQPDIVPFLVEELPASLQVASGQPLEVIDRCAWFAAARGNELNLDIAGQCWNEVVGRDSAFYRQPIDGLREDDARRPFFPRSGAALYRGDLAALDPAQLSKLMAWLQLYANARPELSIPIAGQSRLSAGPQDVTFAVESVMGDGVRKEASLSKYIASKQLQDDQLIAGPALPGISQAMAFVGMLPNSSSLYRLIVPSQRLSGFRGRVPVAVAHVRVTGARVVDDDLGAPVLLVDILPLAITLAADGETIAAQTFDDVPTLVAGAFTDSPTQPGATSVGSHAPSEPTAGSATDVSIDRPVLPLDRGLLDLLALRAAGTQLSPEARVHAVLRRWAIEQGAGFSGPRFFTRGKRKPSEEEAAALIESFTAWAQKEAPELPLRVRAVTSAKDRFWIVGWNDLPCFEPTSADLSGGQVYSTTVGGSERRACERPELLDSQKCHAIRAVDAALTVIKPLGQTSPCASTAGSVSFKDPLALDVRLPQALPAPQIKALGGKQALGLEVILEIGAAKFTEQAPSAVELLPPEVTALTGLRARPGRQDAQRREHVLLSADLIEARYSDVDGRSVDSRPPDEGQSLAAILGSMKKDSAAAASASRPIGPYGRDMIGIKLGMSMADAEAAVRQHMTVGRVMDAASAESAIVPGTLVTGKLFLSADEHELVAIIDGPAQAGGTVRAAWRQVFAPAELPTVNEATIAKYGEPTFGGRADKLLFWSDDDNRRCEAATAQALEYRVPMGQQWTESGAPFIWTAPDGGNHATSPGIMLPGVAEAVGGSSCGPTLTLQFSAGEANSTVNVIETTLTDAKAFAQVKQLTKPAVENTAIKF